MAGLFYFCCMLNPLHKKLALKSEYSTYTNSTISDLIFSSIPENSENPDWIFFSFLNLEDLIKKSKELNNLLSKTDPVIWLAYPKKSGNIKSDINRDLGWDSIYDLGLSPVSQISIDENWSALRWRKTEQIKKMIRTKVKIGIKK